MLTRSVCVLCCCWLRLIQALIPMLFVLYAMELWFGSSFTLSYWRSRQQALAAGTSPTLTFSVLLTGAAFVLLALGNAWTTGRVLLDKSKNRSLKTAVHKRITSSVTAAPAAAAATAGGEGPQEQKVKPAAAEEVATAGTAADSKKKPATKKDQ